MIAKLPLREHIPELVGSIVIGLAIVICILVLWPLALSSSFRESWQEINRDDEP